MKSAGKKFHKPLHNSPMADRGRIIEPGGGDFVFFPRLLLVIAASGILATGVWFIFF